MYMTSNPVDRRRRFAAQPYRDTLVQALGAQALEPHVFVEDAPGGDVIHD